MIFDTSVQGGCNKTVTGSVKKNELPLKKKTFGLLTIALLGVKGNKGRTI